MPRRCATARASAISSTPQHCRRPTGAFGSPSVQSRIVTPMTSRPCSTSSAAATDESTPPLIPTMTRATRRPLLALLYSAYTARSRISRPKVYAEAALDSPEIAERLIDILSDRQAEEIAQIDIRRTAAFADFFVIATAGSARQLNALIDTLEKE